MRPPDDLTNRCSNYRTLAKIQGNVVKRGKRHAVSRFFHAKSDQDAITTWRRDLNRILHIFNVRSVSSIGRLLRVHLSDGAVDE
jgi:hypothetical protein